MSAMTTAAGMAPTTFRLVEGIYAAAEEPRAWQEFLEELVRATGSRSARLLVMNAEATRVDSSIKVNIDDGYHRQYVEHYVNACPWRPELRLMPPGRLYSTYLDFSCKQRDFYRTEFFNEWANPQDIHHGVCGTVFRDRMQAVQLLVQRTRGQGHYSRRETAFFNDLVPLIRRSFLLARRINAMQAYGDAVVIAAERQALPFLLYDRRGRVVHCSPAAEALITGEPLLDLKDGRLRIAVGSLNRRMGVLLRACLDAAAGIRPSGGNLVVSRPDGTHLHLLVTPVHPDLPDAVSGLHAFAAVHLHDPSAQVDVDDEWLVELYGLTPAECAVAVAMADDPRVPTVASRCGIGAHTVRSHLKSIFRKTGASCQADLVRLLLTGPGRQGRRG